MGPQNGRGLHITPTWHGFSGSAEGQRLRTGAQEATVLRQGQSQTQGFHRRQRTSSQEKKRRLMVRLTMHKEVPEPELILIRKKLRMVPSMAREGHPSF